MTVPIVNLLIVASLRGYEYYVDKLWRTDYLVLVAAEEDTDKEMASNANDSMEDASDDEGEDVSDANGVDDEGADDNDGDDDREEMMAVMMVVIRG